MAVFLQEIKHTRDFHLQKLQQRFLTDFSLQSDCQVQRQINEALHQRRLKGYKIMLAFYFSIVHKYQ